MDALGSYWLGVHMIASRNTPIVYSIPWHLVRHHGGGSGLLCAVTLVKHVSQKLDKVIYKRNKDRKSVV